ncbi:MAG: DUF6515 family protein, partial [Rikenellaceae bacterium]
SNRQSTPSKTSSTRTSSSSNRQSTPSKTSSTRTSSSSYRQTSPTRTFYSSYRKPTNYRTPVKVVRKPNQAYIQYLPSRHVVERHNGISYYRCGARYYRRINSRYVVVPPPAGLIVSLAASILDIILFDDMRYYYSDGIMYRRINNSNNYMVIEPEYGMIVPELPDVNVSEVYIDGITYYEFNEVLYLPIPTAVGVQYQVSGNINDYYSY